MEILKLLATAFKRKKQFNNGRSLLAPEEVKTKLVLTDDDGRKWYEYENLNELPAARAIAAEVALKQAEMSLDFDTLSLLIEEMKKAGNEARFTDLLTLVNEIEFRLSLSAEKQTLVQLACVYFLHENEDPNGFRSDMQARKQKIWSGSEGLQDFFIRKAYRLTMNFSDTLEQDITMYLKQTKAEADRLARLVRSTR